MIQSAPLPVNRVFISVIVCACLSVFFRNFFLMSLFYLVPLGYAVLVYGSGKLVFAAVTLVNTVYCIVSGAIKSGAGSLPVEILYFTVLFLGFIWIMEGGKLFDFMASENEPLRNIRCAYRFIIASAASAGVFMFYLFRGQEASVYNTMFEGMKELFSSLSNPYGGGENANVSYIQQLLSPQMLETAKNVLLRGFGVASMFFFFFISRHVAYITVFFRRRQKTQSARLLDFFVPEGTVWVLLSSIALLLASRFFNSEILEIILWNVLTVCGILFLAQGAGILLYILEKRSNTFKIAVNVLAVILIFSPFRIIIPAALLLLGVTESWVAFRRPKQQDTVSTPEP
jgi:hypothetical protein